ncbi:hypothetical protein [Aquimarina sp. 2201CG5-10]|uniref:hypothetical protein n=1 Tax=Aquimarina callyspongiae TaxID=3098150 RepID=UPI002AB4893E|nr:hypothetical protein [Aquimarina sp. 2201CG5-10]MDY8135577.1 hypothetical protein [Aquimarina sp. 2201CG5-10]
MLKKLLKLFLKFLLFCFLTAITQVGGFLYLIVELMIKRSSKKYRLKKIGIFIVAYVFITFLVIPFVAPLFGREKIRDTSRLGAHTFMTKLLNRNYVTPKLQVALSEISTSLQKQHPNIKLIYLDANFPFINGFPLAPHLSHNDGKKIDIAFIYKDQNGHLTNKKPSISGYGIYEKPKKGVYDQTKACKSKGYWQYDIPKYLTFGTTNKSLKFSKNATKDLLLAIVHQKRVGKVFIEPHLKNQMKVQHHKIRFHGCQAVRHDDHIHLQLN